MKFFLKYRLINWILCYQRNHHACEHMTTLTVEDRPAIKDSAN